MSPHKESFINPKKIISSMNKKGQLGIIESKYWIVGFLVGMIVALVLVALGTMEVIPFQIPLVCG